MLQHLSQTQIEFLKRQAKLLARQSDLLHSAALDQLAVKNGYLNWSMLIKHNSDQVETALSATKDPIYFLRSPEEMSLALKKISKPVDGRFHYGPFTQQDINQEAKSQVIDLSTNYSSALNAVQYAIAFMQSVLAKPRFNVHFNSQAYFEMRFWLPYHIQSFEDNYILVGRNYKPVGHKGDVGFSDWVNYQDFKNLHLNLSESQIRAVSLSPKNYGYLYDDSCTPWHLRKNANAYLARLVLLQTTLESV